MGLFNRKKKTQPDAIDAAFDQFGVDNNSADTVNLSRKQQQAKALANTTNEKLKDNLVDKFNEVRKLLFKADGFDSQLNEFEDIIQLFKDVPDREASRAKSTIDRFILNTLNNAITFIVRNNQFGFEACIDSLKEYIADRRECPECYTKDDFVKLSLAKDKLYVAQKDIYSKITQINIRGKQLDAKYHDPKYAANKGEIKEELEKLQKQKTILQNQNKTLDIKKTKLNNAMEAIRQETQFNPLTVDNDDLDAIVDRALEAKETVEYQASDDMDINAQFETSHLKVSDSSININTDLFSDDEASVSNDDAEVDNMSWN